MPELPEVETIRRFLLPHVVGQRIESFDVRRKDILHGDVDAIGGFAGRRIICIDRLGKQLAFKTSGGKGGSIESCFCIHLGMSGSIQIARSLGRDGLGDSERGAGRSPVDPHVHVVWSLQGEVAMSFRDPRRFGGVWIYERCEDLVRCRWGRLGPDAMSVTAGELHGSFKKTTRGIKSCLLDQSMVAGLGNIYVDEILYLTCIHPEAEARGIGVQGVRRLVRHTRATLRRAVAAGGSTIRDYRTPVGFPGSYQRQHRVYGRAGEPCLRCRSVIESYVVSGRTTAYCPKCQVIPL